MVNKRGIISLLAVSMLLGGIVAAPIETRAEQKAKSKNLIILIGDGMGPAQVSAARTYLKREKGIDHLNMDAYYVGQATTYAEAGYDDDAGTSVSGIITDSSAAATAIASGTKTNNAAVGVTSDEVAVPVASIIETAELANKATGLVSTTRITHATPAAFAAHVRSRGNENAIASQLLESGVDVLLAGGRRQFVTVEEGGERTDRSILPDAQKEGYRLIHTRDELLAIEPVADQKVLGLFSDYFMPYVLDRQSEHPSLEEMTQKTLELLSADEDGFVALIEGGRIDMASHANDFPTMLQEVLEFDRAVGVAMEFAKKDNNTSVIVTADHETGGLALGRDSIYELNTDLWGSQAHSHEYYYFDFMKAKTTKDIQQIVKKNNANINLTDEEAEYILQGREKEDYLGPMGRYNRVIAKRMSVAWSGYGHTAVDVGVWAYGPIADLVKGHIDNTDIAKASASVLGLDFAAVNQNLQSKYLYPLFRKSRDGEVLFPARALAEKLGVKVFYNKQMKTVEFHLADKILTADLENKNVNAKNGPVGAKVELYKGKLYMSIEGFENILDRSMEWDALSERIILK